jgi:hypothetical protein
MKRLAILAALCWALSVPAFAAVEVESGAITKIRGDETVGEKAGPPPGPHPPPSQGGGARPPSRGPLFPDLSYRHPESL